ncbi:MAG: nicotinate-nucleotide--dimethylbenzimidazole phosphoribosyltransferase, partial [Alphaproteobacteria bacterium]
MSSVTLSNLAEIRALFPNLPAANQDALASVADREGQLTKPAGSLGRLEEITSWLAA